MKKTSSNPQSIARFEQSLDELEHLVTQIEQGELSLDDSLTAFERGMSLYKQCQGALDSAELRVKQVLDPQNSQVSGNVEPDAT